MKERQKEKDLTIALFAIKDKLGYKRQKTSEIASSASVDDQNLSVLIGLPDRYHFSVLGLTGCARKEKKTVNNPAG